ncbi:Sec-independent protein translocase protein TatB [Lysobacter sp. 1R34A]|uniref:Sec-independent protein translocase protein TatB n=1 Tax=Lysobacter sp. 1R34A TaxID=3445786 RepID=UPI003EEC1E4B
MFDIGFSEVFVIAIVALIVLGPERLPKAARFAGLWVRRARAQWYSVKSELENEIADEDLKRSLRQAQDDLRDAQGQLRDSGRAMREEVDAMNRSIAAPVGAAGDATATEAAPVEAAPDEAAPNEAAPPTHDYASAALPDYRPSPKTPTDERR